MRGVLYPAANVVFSAQADNPGDVKFVPGHDPNMSTDPLTSTFGGWQAVENAALALAESATLLSIPGGAAPTACPFRRRTRRGWRSCRRFVTRA